MKCRAVPGACGRKWVCACHMEKKRTASPDPFAVVGDHRIHEAYTRVQERKA